MRRQYPSLRAYLDDTKETQEQFAARIGISQPGVSRILSGHSVSLKLAKRISQLTGVPIESFGSKVAA